jgi:hypothetical protein
MVPKKLVSHSGRPKPETQIYETFDEKERVKYGFDF